MLDYRCSFTLKWYKRYKDTKKNNWRKPQVLELSVQHILVHTHLCNYNLPVSLCKYSLQCLCFLFSLKSTRSEERQACPSGQVTLPRITALTGWLLGWGSQNNWIIWSITHPCKNKNLIELWTDVSASKDYGSSDFQRKRSGHLVFLPQLPLHLVCGLLYCSVPISKFLNRKCQLYTTQTPWSVVVYFDEGLLRSPEEACYQGIKYWSQNNLRISCKK